MFKFFLPHRFELNSIGAFRRIKHGHFIQHSFRRFRIGTGDFNLSGVNDFEFLLAKNPPQNFKFKRGVTLKISIHNNPHSLALGHGLNDNHIDVLLVFKPIIGRVEFKRLVPLLGICTY